MSGGFVGTNTIAICNSPLLLLCIYLVSRAVLNKFSKRMVGPLPQFVNYYRSGMTACYLMNTMFLKVWEKTHPLPAGLII